MVEENNAGGTPIPGENINAKRLSQTSFAYGGAIAGYLTTLRHNDF
jgi:hypothetical protein